MKAWFANQTLRDQRVLVIGALLVMVAMLWAFVWDPLSRSRAALAVRATQSETDLAWMRGVASELRAGRAQGVATGLDRAGRSLLALADASAREAGFATALKRVEPTSAGRVNIWFEGVAFDAMADWLEMLARQYGVSVEEFVLDRAVATGTVNARLTLVDTIAAAAP
jgi:general secretion pathway protein M